jgi:hypothetical protein
LESAVDDDGFATWFLVVIIVIPGVVCLIMICVVVVFQLIAFRKATTGSTGDTEVNQTSKTAEEWRQENEGSDAKPVPDYG